MGAAMMGAAVLIKNAGRSSDPAVFLGSRADSSFRTSPSVKGRREKVCVGGWRLGGQGGLWAVGGGVIGPLDSVFSKTKPDFMKWLLKLSAIAVLSEMTRSFTLSETGMAEGLF